MTLRLQQICAHMCEKLQETERAHLAGITLLSLYRWYILHDL